MLAGYIPIAVMLALATVIAAGMVVVSALMGPHKATRHKVEPYECGMAPIGSARERFPVRFYLIAMLFIIFDIETVFLYPWAVTYRSLGHTAKVFNLAEMVVFVAILFVGYFYLWGRGALNWDEGRADVEPAAQPEGILAPRQPIRFGNEAGEPVRLPSREPAASGRN